MEILLYPSPWRRLFSIVWRQQLDAAPCRASVTKQQRQVGDESLGGYLGKSRSAAVGVCEGMLYLAMRRILLLTVELHVRPSGLCGGELLHLSYALVSARWWFSFVLSEIPPHRYTIAVMEILRLSPLQGATPPITPPR